ncbi:MAG: alpha-ketoacid dehydrogenase subunit beta [Paenibacillaceae bacterium]|jgi:2-oxoisovalerate dehydrogenase E1 component beta subunit|nr:alpha-ketoacid dehydrogenase subunit beta [Paenibacillaceae bacterium]
MKYIEAIRQAMYDEMARDERVFVLGEDVGKGGVLNTTQGLRDAFGSARVLDTPLSESAIVGVAIGAAMHGMRPIAEMQFADFIFPATNQIISEAAKIRYRSNNDWEAPLVIRVPYGATGGGALYHSQCPESVFFGTPGLKIVAPATTADAYALLVAAVRDPDPVLYFEHKKCYLSISGSLSPDPVRIGQANVQRVGTDVTVITYGVVLHDVLRAAEIAAARDGVSVHVLDVRTLQPLDTEAIVEAASHTGKVMIVHEDNKTGGVGAEIAALICEHALFDLDAPIVRVCGPDVHAVAMSPTLEKAFLINEEMLVRAIMTLARA